MEYVRSLTYRQIMTLWERKWHREQISLLIAAKTSPFASSSEDEQTSQEEVCSDVDALLQRGVNVKEL